MKQRIVAAVIVLTAAIVSGGQGIAETYDCATNAGASQAGYVSDRYIFEYNPDTGQILVVDGLIYQSAGGPIPAKLSSDNEKKISFTWSVNFHNSGGQNARLLYRAAYFKAGNKFTVSARVGGGEYVGAWDARGTCKPAK